MSLADRIAAALTENTRVVLAVLLVTTVLFGAGMPMVDDDSSLDQFESDSPEGVALEDVEENFTVDEQENETTLQLIHRGNGENVLSQESLVRSLEFQQELRLRSAADDSFDGMFAEEDPFTGIENVIGITAVLTEDVRELERRGAELNATSDQLEAGIDESREIQREIDRTRDSQENPESEIQQLESEWERVVDEASTDFNESQHALNESQQAEYADRAEQARMLETQMYDIEQENEDPSSVERYQELQEQMEELYLGATMGVLQDEYEQLEADGQALEEERANDGANASNVTLAQQLETLEGLDDEEFGDVLEQALADENGNDAMALLPTSYEPGSTEADARMTIVTQVTSGGGGEMGATGDAVTESQLAIQEYAEDHDDEMIVFGGGVITDEIDRSMIDSLSIVGPLALLFVVAALLVAYRDPLDIVLGVAGIVAVLIWTFGFMGWAGISFNQMMIAVPVLLIGLSIDYAIHVFMRHREQREEVRAARGANGLAARETDDAGSVRGSMTVALAGVGVALVWVTATTAIGFLANLVSPIGPIREFGIVSSVGILSALIVFGGLIPAAKVELDSWLESRGYDRHKRAFGTGGGRFGDVLSVGAVAARKAPMVLLLVVLLVTAGGVIGATQVDTSFEQEDFLADSPPEWTESLPGGMAPGEYRAAENLDYVSENFQRQDTQAQILVEGDVAGDGTLEDLHEARTEAANSTAVFELANGEPDVRGPLSVMEATAAENESFNESFVAADTNDDGVPDENVGALYDELFAVNEAGASEVIHRTDDGEYESVRLIVGADGTVAFSETTEEMRDIAGGIDDEGAGDRRTAPSGDGSLAAIATGDPVVSHVVEQDLLETVLQSLLITLVAVFAFLTVAYYLTGNGATLGAVTLLPVAFTVSWILGTMYLLGMPFNVLTGMITSLTIGLGVAYSIHVSARYTLELERQGNVWDALETTVTGTGGALLGSAATTIGGFGTLAFAILPALQQFGIITGLTIAYAFLASVVVLPTLLVLWTRYFVDGVSFERGEAAQPMPAASDGGRDPPVDEGDGR